MREIVKWVFKTLEGASNSIYTNVRSFVTNGVQRLDEEEEERRIQRLRATERRIEAARRQEEEDQRLRAAERPLRQRVAEWRRREQEREQRLQVARRSKRARAAERRTLEITQVQNRRLLGNTIAHYEIQNHANLTPTIFLNATRPIVTNFFRRNPGNKFQLIAKHHGKSGSTSPASEMAADERAFRMQEKVLIFSTF